MILPFNIAICKKKLVGNKMLTGHITRHLHRFVSLQL